MRRVGLILVAAGLAGFLFASGREGGAFETARWLLVGTALMGLIFTILPGKKE